MGYHESQQRRSQSPGDRIRRGRQPGIVGGGGRNREQFERDADAINDTNTDCNGDSDTDGDANSHRDFNADRYADIVANSELGAQHADCVGHLAEQRQHRVEYRAHPGIFERQRSLDAIADIRRRRDDRLVIVFLHVMHGKLQLEYEKSIEGDTLDIGGGLQFEWNGGDQRRGERDEVSLRRD